MTLILVVDDDQDIVRLVRSYLEQAGFEVLHAFDGSTALRLLRTARPALVVLDLMLPDYDGWDITRRIRADAELAETAILMLTARVDDPDKIVGLELGADDYVTKPFNPREIVARVRSILRRSLDPPPRTLLSCGGLTLDLQRHSLMVNNTTVDTTPTEFELLRTLMQHPGYVFTRSELIERSLGWDYSGLERTLDSHIKNLRRKIEPDPKQPTYIQTVFGVGYRLEEP